MFYYIKDKLSVLFFKKLVKTDKMSGNTNWYNIYSGFDK